MKMGGVSLHTFSPRLVIPAHAGIQVRCPRQLAWIPAFAGMTERCGHLKNPNTLSTHACFRRSSRRTRKVGMSKTSYYYASKLSRLAQMICDRKTIGIGYFPAKALRLWGKVKNVCTIIYTLNLRTSRPLRLWRDIPKKKGIWIFAGKHATGA